MSAVIKGDSADEVWRIASSELLSSGGEKLGSRCGDCLERLNSMLIIENPIDRWVISRNPAMNVPFALADVVWILSGRNDSKFVNYFNRSLPKYAGTGKTYHGAYGSRLRKDFGFDQLERSCEALLSNAQSRQVVLQIWKPDLDLPGKDGSPVSADVPCNISSMLKVRDGRLHWTQIMRSNDVFLGLPYNFVQFTSIHELMAGWLNLEVGPYVHYSDSLHVYEDDVLNLEDAVRIEIPRNEERLSESFEESKLRIGILEELIEFIIEECYSSEVILERLLLAELPVHYRNWAAVMVAEGCRRRGSNDLARQSLEACMNPLLRFGCARWFERFGII